MQPQIPYVTWLSTLLTSSTETCARGSGEQHPGLDFFLAAENTGTFHASPLASFEKNTQKMCFGFRRTICFGGGGRCTRYHAWPYSYDHRRSHPHRGGGMLTGGWGIIQAIRGKDAWYFTIGSNSFWLIRGGVKVWAYEVKKIFLTD